MELNKNNNDNIKVEPSKGSNFNPDKRIEPMEGTPKAGDISAYNPDTRIETQETLCDDYTDDLMEVSEYPDTIDSDKIDPKNFQETSKEEVAQNRKEFKNEKANLITGWQEKNGKEWPTYKEDVYSKNGSLLREAGDKYDAHHIVPLKLGGTNEVNNITPLHANNHYDHSGIHEKGGPLNKLMEESRG